MRYLRSILAVLTGLAFLVLLFASNSQNGTEFLSSWNGSNWLYLLAPLHGWDWLQHQGVA